MKETEQMTIIEKPDEQNNAKNNNMLCDIILKAGRITSLAYEVLDFNNATHYTDSMILTKTEYEDLDKAITATADLLRQKHIALIQHYHNKREGK